jgi:hypothetical protein
MQPLLKLNLPIIHYENLVEDPQKCLKTICDHIKIPFDESILNPKSNSKEYVRGHGRIDLNKKINNSSNKKHQNLSQADFEKVRDLTKETWEAYGYSITRDNISVST